MKYQDLKKGDTFTMHGFKGTLLTKPVYKITPRSGLYYADVQWADGRIVKNFMICRTAIKWNGSKKETTVVN